jgi:O-antigen ligase
MSNPRDFIPFSKPPLFYLTWSWGIQRLNGLFVGPNTLWFFMIAFFSPLLYILRNNKYKIIITILYIIITIATLSRWAVIGIAFQAIIITLYGNHIGLKEYSNSMRKKIVIIWIISVATLGVLLNINSRKSWSNSERVQSISQTIEIWWKKLFLWYWPGYVGPGKHYEANYLKNQKNPLSMIENIYLQIIINEGIIGFIFRSTIRIWILYIIYRREEEKSDIETLFLERSLTFWLIWLLAVGLFLHVFIDSMVNYLFFIIYGIIISNTTKPDKE